MAITVPQVAVDGTTVVGSTCAGTFGSNTTTGNTVVAISMAGSNASVSSVAISPGSGTFARLIAYSFVATQPLEVWIAPNITGGTTPTVTATYSGSPLAGGIVLYELAGMPTTTQADGTAAGTTGSSTTPTTLGITTTVTNTIVFGAFVTAGTITTPQAGWTGKLEAAQGGAAEYQIQTSIRTALTANCTQGNTAWGAVIFALKGGVSGSLPLVAANPKLYWV